MVTSILEQYSIADFLEWHREKRLKLNPDFQRRSVWSPQGKTMLIDTIIRQLPMPKVYMRTSIDLQTQISHREVVDGQQRLRAITEFSDDHLVLGTRAKEFAGRKYSQLDAEFQEKFLAYTIGVEQLINAEDSDVLEVFSRLNSYTTPLNSAELRHAEFQSDFKWAVHESSAKWSVLWDKFQIVGNRQRLRMADDALMSEMFAIVLEGIKDGGNTNLKRLYQRYNNEFLEKEKVEMVVDDSLRLITQDFEPVLVRPISNSPHFLMLFAAVAHAVSGIPAGDFGGTGFPAREENILSDLGVALQNIERIGEVIEEAEGVPSAWNSFWRASRSNTHRIASRRVRFPVFYKALLPVLFS